MEHICVINPDKIICYSLYSKKFDFEIPNKTILHKNIVSGEDFICTSSSLKINCIGNPQLNKSNENDLKINFDTIKAGNHNICAFYDVKLDPELISKLFLCWGSESTKINDVPAIIDTIDYSTFPYYHKVSDFSIGKNTACMIFLGSDKENSICWGTCPGNLCIIPKKSLGDVAEVKVGYDHACTLSDIATKRVLNDMLVYYGTVNCWGGNGYGQREIPDRYKYIVRQVFTGNQMTCVYVINFRLDCIGNIEIYDFKSHKFTNQKLPAYNMNLNESYYSISTGGRHTCSVYGSMYTCWGLNDYGQLDLPSSEWSISSEISAGWDFTCLHAFDLKISCIGFNYRGQVDIPDYIADKKIEYVKISAGLIHTCVIAKINYNDILSTQVKCWGGHDDYGELMDENIIHKNQFDPKLYPYLISVGIEFTCIVSKSLNKSNDYAINLNSISCVGNNDQSQCEGNKYWWRSYDKLSSGAAHSCVSSSLSNSIYCWGSDQHGQTSIPEHLKSEVYQVTTGDVYTCAIYKVDWSVECWGSWVVQRVTNKRYDYVAAGYDYVCLIEKRVGFASCVGDNEWGQTTVPDLSIKQ